MGWIDAWTTKPSLYAVAARNANQIAATVKFAREHNLRLVVKGSSMVHRSMNELRAVVSGSGAYVSESNFFESDFQHSYWGANYSRLAEVKKKYDPDGLFFVHNGVGSEQWTPDGSTKL